MRKMLFNLLLYFGQNLTSYQAHPLNLSTSLFWSWFLSSWANSYRPTPTQALFQSIIGFGFGLLPLNLKFSQVTAMVVYTLTPNPLILRKFLSKLFTRFLHYDLRIRISKSVLFFRGGKAQNARPRSWSKQKIFWAKKKLNLKIQTISKVCIKYIVECWKRLRNDGVL